MSRQDSKDLFKQINRLLPPIGVKELAESHPELSAFVTHVEEAKEQLRQQFMELQKQNKNLLEIIKDHDNRNHNPENSALIEAARCRDGWAAEIGKTKFLCRELDTLQKKLAKQKKKLAEKEALIQQLQLQLSNLNEPLKQPSVMVYALPPAHANSCPLPPTAPYAQPPMLTLMSPPSTNSDMPAESKRLTIAPPQTNANRQRSRSEYDLWGNSNSPTLWSSKVFLPLTTMSNNTQSQSTTNPTNSSDASLPVTTFFSYEV